MTTLGAVGALLLTTACQAPKQATPAEAFQASNAEHIAQFGDFELPRKLGTVENSNLQIPAIAPDGEQVLYLRADCDTLSAMTLFGSPDPRHTPAQGTVTIWLRPVGGVEPGRQMSHHRWAHSPVWSDSGRAVAYVVNEPPASFIVHVELSSGQEQVLGVAGAINCLPRFDRDDNTLLFCSSQGVRQPFRVFRQLVGAAEPTPLTPQGVDCLCPVLTEGDGRVLCLRADGSNVVWARCGVDGCTDLSQPCGLAARPALIQTWAGITGPLSPDRKNLLFYDSLENRVGIFHVGEKRVIRHRQGSIAACWLTSNAVALATAQDVFLVNTFTGMSPELFNGPWIPCRYVAQSRRLLLLGKHDDRRFAIVEVVFKSR